MISISKPQIGERERQMVNEVLSSGMLAQGPSVSELEKKFAAFCGTDYAVAVNSGTAALHCALYAAGIGPGDEVITTPFSFVATANSILMQGATVVFADIDASTFNIDPEQIARKITPRTKAIVTVDLYGQPAAYDPIRQLAESHDLVIIEDACQAHGAVYHGKNAGALGDLGAFSFYATKNMMCGEGGMITTSNADWAELCKRFRHHGQSEHTRYEYWDLGYNYRMMDLQAAIALAQLEQLDGFTKRRIANADRLSKGLSGIAGLTLPKHDPAVKHVFHQYTVAVDQSLIDRDNLLQQLRESGVGCGVYYPKPLHLHPHFTRFGYQLGDFEVAEAASKQVLSLPVHPSLTDAEIDQVVQVFNNLVVS